MKQKEEKIEEERRFLKAIEDDKRKRKEILRQKLKKRANDLINENMEEVKDLNTKLNQARVVTVRDQQKIEKIKISQE